MYNDLHIFLLFSCNMFLTRVPKKKSFLQSETSFAPSGAKA